MTAHTHTTFVEGCYRCELGRDEAQDIYKSILRDVHLVDPVDMDFTVCGLEIIKFPGMATTSMASSDVQSSCADCHFEMKRLERG